MQLRGRDPGIVGDDHVARREAVDREFIDDMRHACCHRVDVAGRAGDGRAVQPVARREPVAVIDRHVDQAMIRQVEAANALARILTGSFSTGFGPDVTKRQDMTSIGVSGIVWP